MQPRSNLFGVKVVLSSGEVFADIGYMEHQEDTFLIEKQNGAIVSYNKKHLARVETVLIEGLATRCQHEGCALADKMAWLSYCNQ